MRAAFADILVPLVPLDFMGVCCIVFDIDRMLFEFFMNFLNIEKNKILFTFHAISNIKK